MDIKFTNHRTRQKEVFTPQNPPFVNLYVCGPTVYGDAHIGNARPAVVFDILVRLLRARYGKNNVCYVRNITDVDDKINARAAKENTDIEAIASRYYQQYQKDMAALNVSPPDIEPRATEHIKPMLDMIGILHEKNIAYTTEDGHVLFDISRDAEYGSLSGQSREDLLAGARVEVAQNKRNPGDFVLWKPSPQGTPGWDSAIHGYNWGRGRPGWHIECSAMIKAHLGETIDIHGGGVDLQFPHHENECAQSRCAHNAPLARFWLHNGMLNMRGRKMSKSQGNIKTIRELRKDYPGEVLRLALLSGHYRQPLDFSDELLAQCEVTLGRIKANFRARFDGENVTPAPFDAPKLQSFMDALCDDLNTPKALAEFHAVVKNMTSFEDAQIIMAAANLLGLTPGGEAEWTASRGQTINKSEYLTLAHAHEKARQAKNYEKADAIRDELLAGGYSQDERGFFPHIAPESN